MHLLLLLPLLFSPLLQELPNASTILVGKPLDENRPVVWLKEDFETKRRSSSNAIVVVKVENVAAEKIDDAGKAMVQGAGTSPGRKSYRFKVPESLRNNVLIKVFAKGKLEGEESQIDFSLRTFAKEALYSSALHESTLKNWQQTSVLAPMVEFRVPQLETTHAHKYDFEFDFRISGRDAQRAYLDEVLIVIAGAG